MIVEGEGLDVTWRAVAWVDGCCAEGAEFLPALVGEVGWVVRYEEWGSEVACEGCAVVEEEGNAVVGVAGGADDLALDAYIG